LVIYFPYRWYNAGFVDRIMGFMDGIGVSEHYDLEGTSGSRCEAFTVGNGNPQLNFPGFRVAP